MADQLGKSTVRSFVLTRNNTQDARVCLLFQVVD